MQIRELDLASTIALPLAAALAAARGRGGGCGRVWSSGHARAAAETADCRLGRLRGRRRARIGMRRPALRAAEAPNGEVSSLSVGRCVSRRVGRSSEVGGSISRLGLCLLGPSVGAGHQDFVNHRKQEFGRLGSSSRLSVGLRRSL